MLPPRQQSFFTKPLVKETPQPRRASNRLLLRGRPKSRTLCVQIENDNLGSMLFWGPPGCGKTTLARLIARLTSSAFVSFSAVLAGIKEIKEVMAVAEQKSRS